MEPCTVKVDTSVYCALAAIATPNETKKAEGQTVSFRSIHFGPLPATLPFEGTEVGGQGSHGTNAYTTMPAQCNGIGQTKR